MNADRRLLLVEQEVERWVRDERAEPAREAVHYDRLVRILHDTPTRS